MPARPRFRLPSRPPLLAVALLGALPGLAAAVDFGRLELRSSLGQPLRAEVGVSAEAGESLVAGCLRVAAPGPHELPTIDDARLDLRPASGGKRLSISTARPLTEPAAVLVIEVDCGAGRSRHELPVLPKPAAAGGDWVVAAGESPESLARTLFPGQPAAQRRFVAALALANPAAGIDPANPARTLPAGGRLRWPDWRALAADAGKGVVPSKAMRAGDEPGDAVAPAAGQLQLSRELSAAPVVDDRTRETLRREYQLLDMLQRAMSGGLPLAGASAAAGEGGTTPAAAVPAAAVQTQAPLPPAAAATEASAAPPATATPATPAASVTAAVPPAPPVSAAAAAAEPPPAGPQSLPAVAAPQAGPKVVPTPAVAVDEDAAGDPMLFAAAGLAAALLLLLLLVRRRRAAAQAEREEFQNAQTIVLERPLLAPVAGEPSVPPPTLTAAAPAIPQPPEESDANPVMELAEIMLSFGRLQGAAQTLQEYIEANPKEALQPWMKLLDIYREGGMRSEFDTLAGKLHGNFNVEVQQWNGGSPPLPVDTVPRVMRLEELPHICERITAIWGTQECLDYLHQLLRDNRGGERISFTLPVVQEILLLIDIMTNRENAA